MSDQVLEQLGAEVAAAARRRDRRRRGGRRAASMVAAAVVVALVAVSALLISDDSQVVADVEVIRQGDELVVKLNDLATRPEEVEAAAAEAGVDIDVIQVPVGPSNVGRAISTYQTEGTEVLILPTGDDGEYERSGFRIPADYEGTIDVTLGRAARPGEQWQAASLATERGEALACQELVGRPLAETLRAAEEAELRITKLIDLDPAGSPTFDRPTRAQLERFAEQIVVGLDALGPDELWITTAPSTDSVPELQVPHGC